jgi:glycosyltransferase involved in cell wall biosynthesis
LNILFVADVSINKVIGGAERVLYEQTTRLANRGHNVFVMTRKLPDHRNNYKVIDGVHEERYPVNKNNLFRFLYNTWAFPKKIFEKLQKKNNFDVINFHQPFSAFGVVQSNLSAPISKIYTCHSLSFEEFRSRNGIDQHFILKFGSLILSKGYKKIEKDVLRKSDEILVLSKFTKKKICNIYKINDDNIRVIPGGVDLNKFAPTTDKNAIRKQLKIPSNKIILLTVRNLVKRMGLENLIIAFNDVIKKNADINLVIGGEGKLKTSLSALAKSFGIENYIHFIGFIPEEQLPSYYKMADLFILPSKELEGFGLVTLEALASGVPVVGTSVGGTKEILGKFDSNFLLKGTDPNAIAELITEKYQLIKHSPQRWNEISFKCRNFVENNYSWEKNINSLEDLFVETTQNQQAHF